MGNIIVNEGTAKPIATDIVGTQHYGIVKLDMGTAGVSNPFSGTIPAITNLAGGTITRVEGGTITISNAVGTTVQFNNGTVDLVKAGTITRLEGGTVQTNILTGTVTSVTDVANLAKGTVTRIEGGTIGLITRVGNVGTVEVGTISTLPNIPGGTITRVSTIGTLEVGTISALPNTPGGTLGLITRVSTIGTLELGTVTLTNPTGTTVQFNNGTVDLLKAGTITRLEGGTLGVVTTVSNVTNGSIVMTVGTIASMPAVYAEDAGHSTGNNGLFILGVRNDAGTSLAGTDLDYAPLSFDENGNLRTTATLNGGTTVTVDHGSVRVTVGTINTGTVNLLEAGTITRVEGGSIRVTVGTINTGTVNLLEAGTITRLEQGSINVTAGTITNLLKVEDAGHSTGESGVMSLAVRVDGGTSLVGTDLDYAPLQVDAQGALRISGTVTTGAGTQPVRLIDGTLTELSNLAKGTITRVEGGTLGLVTTVSNLSAGSIAVTAGTITNLLKTEDAGHSTGDSGVMQLAVRVDGGTSLVGTDLDYAPLQVDGNGALRVTGTVATGAGTQPVRLIDGTLTELSNIAGGTITRLAQGSINVTAGTINVTAFGADIPGGTIDEVTSVANLAMGTITRLEGGTLGLITAVTTVSNLSAGSIAVTAGTITNLLKTEDAGHSTGDAGLMPLAVRVDGGTSLVGTDLDYAPLQVDAQGALRISGTVATGAGTQPVSIIDGTVTEVANLAKGTITRVEGGTIGLITAVTTVSNLSAGSIAVTAGTITNLLKAEDAGHSTGDSGVMSMAVRNDNGTALAGTDLDYIPLTTDSSGALRTVGTISSVLGGSIVMTAGTVNVTAFGADIPGGTIDEVTSVANGTIRVSVGTIATGTINTGTINLLQAGTITRLEQGSINITAGTVRNDVRTTQNVVTYGTQVVGTAAIAATIVGSASVGAGTSLWVNDFSIMNPYGSVLCVLGFGTAQQGTNVLFRGVLGTQTGLGIEKSYAKAVNAGMTNQDLVLSLGAAGTVDLSISYLISA